MLLSDLLDVNTGLASRWNKDFDDGPAAWGTSGTSLQSFVVDHDGGDDVFGSNAPPHDPYEWLATLGVFLITLMTCEVVAFVVCYPQILFYRQGMGEWIVGDEPTTITTTQGVVGMPHSSPSSRRNGQETIANSLCTWKMSRQELHPIVMPRGDDCSCPICLLEFEPDDTVAHSKMMCRHLFHEACIRQWMYRHSSCPCCRQAMVASPSSTTATATMSSRATASTTRRRLEQQQHSVQEEQQEQQDEAFSDGNRNDNILSPLPRNTPTNDPGLCLFIF